MKTVHVNLMTEEFKALSKATGQKIEIYNNNKDLIITISYDKGKNVDCETKED